MQIGELGKRIGVSAKTIRYYEQIGIVAEPERTSSGYRDYDGSALERLEFIKAAQAVTLSLGEIREILAFRDRGQTPCNHVTELMKQKVRSLSEHIRGLEQMRAELQNLLDRTPTFPQTCGDGYCHIIVSGDACSSQVTGVGKTVSEPSLKLPKQRNSKHLASKLSEPRVKP